MLRLALILALTGSVAPRPDGLRIDCDRLASAEIDYINAHGTSTMADVIELAAVERLLGEPVRVVGAGRTDAGVHAAGQVAHFDAPGSMPPGALVRSINARLRPEIRILSALPVPGSFHARKDSLGKLRGLRILKFPNEPLKPP